MEWPPKVGETKATVVLFDLGVYHFRIEICDRS
jgi:hypothetical protein